MSCCQNSKIFLTRIQYNWFISLNHSRNLLSITLNAIVIVLVIGMFASPVFGQINGLDYDIRGGKVANIEIDEENTSLIISLDVRARGELTITLPRNLIDAKNNSEDSDFKILVGGLNLNFFDETKTEIDRTITIPFTKSDDKAIITGTHLFGKENAPQSQEDKIQMTINEELEMTIPANQAKLLIFSDTQWSGALQSSSFPFTEIEGSDDDYILFNCESGMNQEGIFGAKIQKTTQDGYLKLVAIQNQKIMSQDSTEEEFGEILINGECISDNTADDNGEFIGGNNGGGCLIATATYGSEMAPQVQQLREIRDNKLLNTESGANFVNSFNEFYYSFSPIIADYQRENPAFREMVKIAITPMIASLSILNHVNVDSEAEVLGYGISLITLNVMMYLGIPMLLIAKFRRRVMYSL